MKKLFFVFAVLLLAGCQAAVEKSMESQIEKQTGAEADVDISGREAKISVETDEGTQNVEMKVKNEGSWCMAGSEWTTSGAQGMGKMVIVGIESSGKYAGYCHVKYDMQAQGGQANADFYFTEEGAGYQVIEVNGQKFESQWTAPTD